jgi:asparagine N-glycosylation enzyme membrane subunit Stt3
MNITDQIINPFELLGSAGVVISLVIMIFLMFLQMIIYRFFRIIPLLLGNMLISMLIGGMSMRFMVFPFSPYFQLFFIFFQVMFLIKASLEFQKRKKDDML